MANTLNKLVIPLFGSIAQASAASGVPVQILRIAKKNGCPGFIGNRVDIGEFFTWWFNRDHEEAEDWTRRDKRAAALTKEAKLALVNDNVAEVNQVTRAIQHIISNVFFGELERMATEFPSTLKGKGEVAIFEECNRQIESVKRLLDLEVDKWVRGEERREKE